MLILIKSLHIIEPNINHELNRYEDVNNSNYFGYNIWESTGYRDEFSPIKYVEPKLSHNFPLRNIVAGVYKIGVTKNHRISKKFKTESVDNVWYWLR